MSLKLRLPPRGHAVNGVEFCKQNIEGSRVSGWRSLGHFGDFSHPIANDYTSFSRSPSVTFADSSLPEGAFYTMTFRPIPTAFLLISIAYLEPRHYGGLFVAQQKETHQRLVLIRKFDFSL